MSVPGFDSWLRSHGLFEMAALYACDDNQWSRGSLELVWREYQAKWPCTDCDRRCSDCVCHERSETE
jgi:hypothetical protein